MSPLNPNGVGNPESLDKLINTLEERVRELNVLYEIEELLHNPELELDEIFKRIANLLPSAFQYPEICKVKITYQKKEFTTAHFKDTPWALTANLYFQNRVIGQIRVCYTEEKPTIEVGPFLRDEKETLNTLAQRLSYHIMYLKLKQIFDKWETAKNSFGGRQPGEWKIILELLKRTDPDVYLRISRKMLNHLVWKGIAEANDLLQKFNPYAISEEDKVIWGETNAPLKKKESTDINRLAKEIFDLASKYLTSGEILERIQRWMQEDKTSFLVRTTSDNNSSLTDINEALRRYYQINPQGMQLSPSTLIGVRASLIRRFFTDQLEFINIAKNYVHVRDFYRLLQRMIFPIGSHGKLGGKSAGVFLAYHVLETIKESQPLLENIKTPKTWHITSDAMIYFMHYNNLDEMLEQKYKPINEVRKEYPHVVQLFKNSYFPPEIVKGIAMALDDFGERPLIVRSSSLLEDRLGSAFSGKYKSLFIANQGSKAERLEALCDAIAEVYASTIGPDPIEYRAERGLLDFHEEMGIMIQEVVGERVGPYFMPAFAGVAFSNNEFRWSPRIRREDGLIRLVPGLGTRAVDRLSDDYPVMIAPGQPQLRANVDVQDIIRYSPQKIDVINLKSNTFESIDIKTLFQEYGDSYPMLKEIVSVFDGSLLRPPGFNTDFKTADLVVTFNGLLQQTDFIKEIHIILKELQNRLATPVDIEFAHDGRYFYLLQCRPQSYTKDTAPAQIPKSVPPERLIFTANKYITNGIVADIQFIVYVDPEQYARIKDVQSLKTVGRVVGELNKILPKKRFILMGPGRWGSRGDIRLGVSVTYSDINNTAALIEIARKKGNYVPDLSFGTHFFQDLVEAGIKYLPLYPDEEGNVFNEDFLTQTPNALYEILPALGYLGQVIHLIDVPKVSEHLYFHLLMNGEQNKAIGMLAAQGSVQIDTEATTLSYSFSYFDYQRWRRQMVEKIASNLDANYFGIKGLYILGNPSYEIEKAGSTIDLLVHFNGNSKQRAELEKWLEGWSLCLDEMNYQRTGVKTGGLLNVRFVTDEDLADEEVLAEKYNIIGRAGIERLLLKDETA